MKLKARNAVIIVESPFLFMLSALRKRIIRQTVLNQQRKKCQSKIIFAQNQMVNLSTSLVIMFFLLSDKITSASTDG